MDATLLVGVADAPQLASGVADKLRATAVTHGLSVVPTSKTAVVGRQWRLLAQLAGLGPIEAQGVSIWIEEAVSEDAALRFAAELPTVATGMASFTAPATAAPAPSPPDPAVASLSGAFASLSAGAAFAGAPSPAPALPPAVSVDASATGTLMQDERSHGFEAGLIAFLTFVMHTARTPPPAHPEVKYGVDPTAMEKIYKTYQRAPGTVLWDLVTKSDTTMRQFQDHFHRAQQAASVLL